jgi:hypothetical protein
VAKGHEASHKPLDILDILDLAYFNDGRDLVRVCFDTALGDDVPQELAPGGGGSKVHFFEFNLMLKCLRLLKVSSRSTMRLLLYRDFTMISST